MHPCTRTTELVQVDTLVEHIHLCACDAALADDVLDRLALPHWVRAVVAAADACQDLLVAERQLAGWQQDRLALLQVLRVALVVQLGQLAYLDLCSKDLLSMRQDARR